PEMDKEIVIETQNEEIIRKFIL
ncbi:hypothetical protein LCGC14_1136200, partial [marine sediment metagenome]